MYISDKVGDTSVPLKADTVLAFNMSIEQKLMDDKHNGYIIYGYVQTHYDDWDENTSILACVECDGQLPEIFKYALKGDKVSINAVLNRDFKTQIGKKNELYCTYKKL